MAEALQYEFVHDAPGCPIAEALIENEMTLKRELRRLKRNISMCRICTAQNGECSRKNSIVADLQSALQTALTEMGLSGEEWSKNKPH